MSDATSNHEETLNKYVRNLRIIVIAMFAAGLLFFVFGLVKRTANGDPQKPPLLALIGVAFAVGELVAAVIVPKVMCRKWERQLASGFWPAREATPHGPASPATPVEDVPPDQASLRWWGLYVTTVIVRAALIEGCVLFQGVAYLLEGNLFSLLLGGVLLGLLLPLIPSRERFDRWVEARREAVETIRSGAVP